LKFLRPAGHPASGFGRRRESHGEHLAEAFVDLLLEPLDLQQIGEGFLAVAVVAADGEVPVAFSLSFIF
jgi:hypothetical protein